MSLHWRDFCIGTVQVHSTLSNGISYGKMQVQGPVKAEIWRKQLTMEGRKAKKEKERKEKPSVKLVRLKGSRRPWSTMGKLMR